MDIFPGHLVERILIPILLLCYELSSRHIVVPRFISVIDTPKLRFWAKVPGYRMVVRCMNDTNTVQSVPLMILSVCKAVPLLS